jgi:hypothetical protein
MTEIVIRFDPQRALQAMVCGARRCIERGASYTKPLMSDRRTHLKLGMGAIGVFSLLVIYSASKAITATPPPKSALAQRFDDAAADTAKANALNKGDRERIFRKIDMSKLAAFEEPKPVATERIMPHAPPTMAIAAAAPLPVTPEVEDDPPPPPRARAKRHAAVTHQTPTRGDICTRHKLRKIVTRGGKAWRCGR